LSGCLRDLHCLCLVEEDFKKHNIGFEKMLTLMYK
jgi:hypothetical protein